MKKITMPKQNAKNEAVSANRKRLLNNDSPFAIKESYVKLRTILMFCMTADSKRACRTFAITSSNPYDGKKSHSGECRHQLCDARQKNASYRRRYEKAESAQTLEDQSYDRTL